MESNDNTCIVKTFSIGGQEAKSDVVHYVMFDWACKVTSIAFNISFPLLITVLGDAKFGEGKGKIVFSYLTTIVSILVSLSYLTFTSVFEYGLMKRKGLSRFAFISSIFLMLFIFCFVGDAIYLACILVIISRVAQSIAQIAYDSLLDAISKGRDPHSVSTRGYITGYSGMLAFLVYAAPILGILYGVAKVSALWYEGIVPSVLVGTWYFFFLIQVEWNLPKNLGQGLPFPFNNKVADVHGDQAGKDTFWATQGNGSNSPRRSTDQLIDTEDATAHEESGSWNATGGTTPRGSEKERRTPLTPSRVSFRTIEEVVTSKPSDNSSGNLTDAESVSFVEKMLQRLLDWYVIIKFSFVQGSKLQYENIIEATQYKDLSWFIVAFIFLSGSSNTAQSVAVIVATQILNLGIEIVILATIIGLFSAIAGIAFFKYLIFKKWITPQYVLVINVLVIVVVLILVLYINTASQLLIAAAVTGTQIGPIGALSRSIVSSLIPSTRQSRLFSLYQFSQDSTSWIGSLIIAGVSSAYGGSDPVYLKTVVIVCVVEIALGLPCLLMMNYDRGVQLRRRKEEEEGGEDSSASLESEGRAHATDTEAATHAATLDAATLRSNDSFKEGSNLSRSLL